MTRKKRKFSYPERFAVWHCNEHKCWWCKEPLRLVEVTVDHVLPESLLDDELQRQKILEELKVPRKRGQGAENTRKKNRHVHDDQNESPALRS